MSIRIRNERDGFVLFRRDPKTSEITERLLVGPASELRKLSEFLNDTADAFSAAESYVDSFES